MKIEVEIEVDTPHAREVEEAVRVDNVDLPQGIQLTTYHTERAIFIVAKCECDDPKKVLTLRNTIDDILTHIKTVLQVLEATE